MEIMNNTTLNELSYLLQTDLIDTVENKWGNETWTMAYKIFHEEKTHGSFYCAFLPIGKVESALDKYSFDFYLGSNQPQYWVSRDDEGDFIAYEYFMDYDEIKPLVLFRDFDGIKPSHLEILEEFRLFHNLYYDRKSNKYIKIIEGGEEIEAILLKEEEVLVKTSLIMEFISIKRLCFSLFCDSMRYATIDIQKFHSECYDDLEVKSDHLIYGRFIRDDSYHPSSHTMLSRFIAKKIILPLSEDKAISFYLKKEINYQSFIVAENNFGEKVLYTCNPDLLKVDGRENRFPAHYLTKVFFKRDVLGRYYNNPDKYTVNDGYLACGNLWSIYIDNNHEKYIIVYLGDLGTYLSESEQLYWKSFNISPDGEMSKTNYERSMLAKFSEPLQADLLFKQNFEKFNKIWLLKFNWYLFKPLSDGDAYLFAHLRIPVNDSQSEFDYQVLTLTKILIDSLNEEAIGNYIVIEEGKNIKGIKKFELFLKGLNYLDNNSLKIISFFRNLQDLRSSSVGHRKSKNYQKISKIFEIDSKKLSDVFISILNDANICLSCLEQILSK